MKKIHFLFLLLFSSFLAFSQIREVNFESRVNLSSVILEGKVLSQNSFWDDLGHNIYTSNEIEVYKVFKGDVFSQRVEIITLGGTVGLEMEVVEPSLQLKLGEVGIFMLESNNISIPNNKGFEQFKPYASVQGFLKYNLESASAKGPFRNFDNIEKDLYPTINKLTNSNYTEIAPFFWGLSSSSTMKAASISNFSPTSVSAGTATTITINGSGFGASAGTVSFSNADDGGSTFVPGLSTEIVSWNDNQIVVEVSADAGTGPIQVNGSTSASNLTVNFAELNVNYDPGSGTEAYQTQHVDRDGSGGYVWQMFTDFDASAANAAFVRAMDSWTSCSGTKINWTIGATTSTDLIANDDINVIRHDNGGELPNGVLGRCTSRWSGCAGATINWYVEELDIVFDDGTNWNYSTSAPGFTEYDFESVAVHELGHGHQLGHVINTNDVMHYAISNGEQLRSPSANNLAGGNDVMSRSTSSSVCSQSVMTEMSCSTAPVAAFSADQTTVCPGTTITFTDESTNTPTSWSWNFGGGATNSTNQNPSVVFNTPGTYTVTLTATNAGGSDDEIKTNYITVNSSPSITSDPTNSSIIDGGNTSFSVTASNTTSYQWEVDVDGEGAGLPYQTISNGGVYSGATTSTLNITGATVSMSGYLYRCVVTGDCNPSSTSNPATLTVNAGCTDPDVPTISGTTTICKGNSTTLSINTGNLNDATNWKWYLTSCGGDLAGSGTSVNVSPSITTTYYVRGEGGCVTPGSCAEVVVTVNSIDVSSTSSTNETCAGNDGTATVNPAGGSGNYSYLWDDALAQTTQTATGLSAATYNVVVSDNITGCEGSTNVVVGFSCPGPNIYSHHCNRILSSDQIYTNCTKVSNATQYEFQLVEQGTSTQICSRSTVGSYFKLAMMVGWEYNTTYEVSARAYVNGVWTEYGPSCLLTTPLSVPSPVIYSSHCNRILSSDQIYTNCTKVSNATQYEFQLVEQGTSTQICSRSTVGSYFKLAMMVGWEYNTTYEVSARAYVNGVWTEYGPSCLLTTPSSGGAIIENISSRMISAYDDMEITVSNNLNIYPNPNQGEFLYVELNHLGNDAELIITDIYGKQVQKEFLNTEDSNYNLTVKFNQKLESGFYLVTVVSNGHSLTKKLVVR